MENRSLALRYLSDALNLDSNGSYQAAFTKYLQSLHVLTLYLNEMFASLGFQNMIEKNKEIKKVLNMVHECSDRIAVIVDSGKKNSAVNVIHKKVSDNVLTDIDIMDSKSSKFPAFEKLQNDNLQLLKRYQWRFERAADKNAKANLKLELERQLIENDMIAKKKFDIERVQWMEQEMKKLLETKKNLNDKQKEKQELYLTVLQYTKTETWPCTWELSSSEMMPKEAAKKIFQKTVRCSGHPLAQWLLVMQTNIKREIDTMLKHHSDYQVLLPEPSLILEENKLNISEFPDEFIIETSISGTIHISKKILLSLQKFLGTISSEITDTIENILEIFYLIYKSLLPEDSEEICHRLIETHILDTIWSNLIILFRITNIPSEYKIVETMIYHRNSDPAKFGFSNDENIDSEVYENSICLLQNVIKSNSMTEKLRCIVNVAKTICGNPNNQLNPNRRKLGADDLIPLLCYIIVKSGLPQLSSECFAIEQLFDMKYMFGEEGYALSSFLTALKYIEIRTVIDEEHNEQD
ncbi:VPS9 domain-containing protein 1 [Caerostris darwini]|uniref:VPS9 domain-containing protein 1 n=1 Tax=Caerostris darwini TaxID=1538125 RepID=A0AAV4N690_9ARAC|nr:VPS9 domain-containing protein 1 [Caerostris darwini]